MIAVVDLGSGNLRSVAKAIEKAGGEVTVTSDPDVVVRADRVVVPGQGEFRTNMEGLAAHDLEPALREVVRAGKPFLGICIGMQILFDESAERGPVRGLGILPGRIVRFDVDPSLSLKIPHMGWNDVRLCKDDPLWKGLPERAFVYFVHSYYAVPAQPITCLETDYGGPFCAAIRHDNIFACQFHPEKSQAVGLALLANFVRS